MRDTLFKIFGQWQDHLPSRYMSYKCILHICQSSAFVLTFWNFKNNWPKRYFGLNKFRNFVFVKMATKL